MHHRTPRAADNPLMREADRTRARLRVVLVVACLLAAVCGVAVGRSAWTDSRRAAEEIAAHRHSVRAVAVGESAHRAGTGLTGRPVSVAPVTWQDTAHRLHTQSVPVPAATRHGDTVRLWIDDRGNPAPAPPGAAETALNAIGLGAGASAVGVLAAGALVGARLRGVDRRSARAWEREWENVEPRWSGRLRPGQGTGDD
ncbi:hypothetical protein ACFV6G_20715 [Streptomyces lavendulae]|uniref:Rv1733c family protein n=1 Tax=Streptomyces lavendulae TaxID=1914 RepID=UPI0036AF41C0